MFLGCSQKDSKKPANLLIISLDTLRADHLGCYGHHRNTSPFLDKLVQNKNVVLFENCVAQSPTTIPSHMTLFTSLHPLVHGVTNQSHNLRAKKAILPNTLTLAQLMDKAGYQTAGITDGGNLYPIFGLAQGFKEYACKYEGAEVKTDQAIQWFENLSLLRPYFLFLHTYEIHAPYTPPAPFHEMFTKENNSWIREYCFGENAKIQNDLSGFNLLFDQKDRFTEEDCAYLEGLYDGCIAYTDTQMERLWSFLEEKNLLENLLVVILSDHGEEFNEHGDFKHSTLYNEVVKVPLIFILPKGKDKIILNRVKDIVGLVDVMPTILELMAIKAPPYLQGKSLVPLWTQEGADWNRPVYSEITKFQSPIPVLRAVQAGQTKLIKDPDGKRFEVYDLLKDPNEKAVQSEDLKDLNALWEKSKANDLKLRKTFKARFVKTKVDPSVTEELKQLGY